MMTERKKELARLIQSVVRDEHVITGPELRIDNLSPSLLVEPGSAKEVAECLKICAELNATVVPAGLMTWLECGNPVKSADVVLSLERMSRIVEYSPPDLTVTVEGGLTLSEFNIAAKRERQWLPFDPPGFATASLGAVAACNSSGALRAGFGAPRDYVIGLRLAHADGTESKSGGRVVKNVAGYDMNKLYVGSFGTLAVLTELTFKLRPLPESTATLVIGSENRDALIQLADRIIASDLRPASIFLTKRLLKAPLNESGGGDALLLRFIESEAAVTHQVNWVASAAGASLKLSLLDEESGESAWKLVADLDRQAANAIKVSVPVSTAAATYERMLAAVPGCVAAADIAAGIIRMAFDADNESAIDLIKRLRATAGGSLFIERAPTIMRQHADAWGSAGATAALMRSIKDKFDPQSLLNPGRFVSGI